MIQFVNITKEEFLQSKLLYKHLPLENALRTLKDKSLWFANPMTWKDPFERRFLEAKYMLNGEEKNFTWKGKVFCTCMTQTITSESFWNIYSQGSIGIELRVYREKLLEELSRYDDTYNIFIGKAEYLKTDDIRKDLRKIPFDPPVDADDNINTNKFAARLFLLKRIAYKYEDEIRIILVKKNATKENGIAINYECENNELFQLIVLNPNIGDYTAEMLKSLFINEYGFSPLISRNGKLFNRVLRSQLYAKQKQVTLALD